MICLSVLINNFSESLFSSGALPKFSDMVRGFALFCLASLAVITVFVGFVSVNQHIYNGMCEREALPLFFPITKEALAECNAGHAPEACHRIHAEDVVKNETDGNECVEWCHMTGLLLPSAARMDVMGCFKAEAWAAFSLLNWGGVIWTAVIAACAYQLIRSCGQKETPSDPSKANPDENNGTTNGTPSTTEFSERGPYLNAKLPWGITEMAFRSASKNDRAAEKLKLISDLVLSQFEPFMDIYSGVSLLAQGQPYYGFGMLAATLLPSWFHDRDPFQRGMVKELQRSIHQGYSTRGMLEHQDREGRYEGTMSAIVAACALIRTPSLPVSTTLTLLISVVSSFFISIPTGCRARKILDSGIDKDNYYGAEEAKRDMSWGEKFYLSAWTVHLGCVLGWFCCSVHELGKIAFGFGELQDLALPLSSFCLEGLP